MADTCEDEGEWLTARNKKKMLPLTKIKKNHPKANQFKKPSIIRLTQNSPPPPELFVETKQSSIKSFFGISPSGTTSLNKRGNSSIVEKDKSADAEDHSDLPSSSLDGIQSNSDGNNSYMEDDLHSSTGAKHFIYPRADNLQLPLRANGKLFTSASKSTDLITGKANDRRRKKRKVDSADFQDPEPANKMCLIDSEMAMKELEDFYQKDELETEGTELDFSTPGGAGPCLRVPTTDLIDSEEADLELQNFTVDTENLSQYICKANS